VIHLETLRAPFPVDFSASAYKDWFHLNFADPESGTIGLINVSLHGSPWDARSLAMGTVLVHSPQLGWHSYVENMAYSEANLSPSAIALRDVALAIDDRSGTIHASSLGSSNPFHARLRAESVTTPVDFEQEMPLGSGWISWYLVPTMLVSGEWTVQKQRTVLNKIPAYHDHNWGRWYWGDDFGWEWGCFLSNPSIANSPTVVFARTTDRAHRHVGKPFLMIDSKSARHCFSAETISVKFNGNLEVPLHRVPGAMAALHQEMAEPWLPSAVEIRASQGSEHVEISFIARAAAQFITADPAVRGYGFIHEIVGEYKCRGVLHGVPFETNGCAVFEYVI
jgi:hypothetical protein